MERAVRHGPRFNAEGEGLSPRLVYREILELRREHPFRHISRLRLRFGHLFRRHRAWLFLGKPWGRQLRRRRWWRRGWGLVAGRDMQFMSYLHRLPSPIAGEKVGRAPILPGAISLYDTSNR